MVEILFLLIAAIVAVLLFARLGLGSVLGYLAAGAVIGPHGLKLITDAENLRHIGEFGVVFLLFLIGIEMKPQRLWVMRYLVFGLGGVQILGTGALLTLIIKYALGMSIEVSLIIGFGLSLSSTAFGVQLLSERKQMTAQHGRNSFAVLLMQDLAVVPFMVLLPLFAVGQIDQTASMGQAALNAVTVLKDIAIFGAILLAGRYAIKPILHATARIGNSDIFVALALLLVLGFAWVMEYIGFSMAMGAFIAGVLLANSEYRHQVEADVLPFRGLLLGLFFMSVGMTLNPQVVAADFGAVIGCTAALLIIKTVFVIGVSRFWRISMPSAVRSGALLSQAGEFGFVLFSLAAKQNMFPEGIMGLLIPVMVLSMIATPAMVWLGDKIATRLEADVTEKIHLVEAEEGQPVLIAGFGRVGRTIVKILNSAGVPYVAVDTDADTVARGRQRGYRVYYGDASRPEVLRAVGAARAKLMVVTLDNHHAAEGMVRAARRLYPDVPILVRTRDWETADKFISIGAAYAMPETVEASLRLGAIALEVIGIEENKRKALLDDLSADNYENMRNYKNK